MFGRIVVGTDGSETAGSALSGRRSRSRSWRSPSSRSSAFEPISRERLRDEAAEIPGDIQYTVNPREDVNLILDTAAGEAKREDVEVLTHPREGDPADAILDVAEETGADLIVVGNKGMTGAKRFLLGSVPNKISHHAPCDVLIARTT